MQLEKEIERAVRHQIALNREAPKSTAEIKSIVEAVNVSLCKNTLNFSNASSIILHQGKKTRLVKQYINSYAPESILCQCIKQILDKNFKIKYPNRNKTIKSLFEILSAVKNMSDFTIIKFDFKDYFNSISSIYVFEKYLKPKLRNRDEIELIKDFVYKTKHTYAGFSTSNAMAEIVACQFDNVIRQTLAPKNIIFFERYVDDSILILNEHIEEDEIIGILKKALNTVFYDTSFSCSTKCKTNFNPQKEKYISRRTLSKVPIQIDYLGYEFFFSLGTSKKNYTVINYGITQDKRNKYKKRIDKLIECYSNKRSNDFNNLELLRQRIAAFTSREVYLSRHFNSNIWRIKGFIANYGELRYLLKANPSLVHKDTVHFLKDMVNDAFVRANITMPYFIKGSLDKSGYNLFYNMLSNKTLLLIENIGYDYASLINLCQKIGINKLDVNGKRRGYGTLVKEYLIKVKVGY